MPHLLSNIQDDRRQLMEQAIINTKRSDIFCRDEAYGSAYGDTSYKLLGYFGLYVQQACDCSDFWAEVSRLEATDYWRTYLALVSDSVGY